LDAWGESRYLVVVPSVRTYLTAALTVHAAVPLSLLEALRNLDTPSDDGLNELATETVAKRLGLSSTVAFQIERYRELVSRNERVSVDEAVSVFRLVGRRPDAELVYSDAGRRAARYAVRSTGSLSRPFLRVVSWGLRRRLGVRAAARIARQVLGGDLRPGTEGVAIDLADNLATLADTEGSGCYFYSAGFSELLRVTSGFEGSLVHERCRSRGDQICAWRGAKGAGSE